MVSVAITGGVDVGRFVGIGVGDDGVSEARSGPIEAHPALKNNPREIINRKIRDMITNQSMYSK